MEAHRELSFEELTRERDIFQLVRGAEFAGSSKIQETAFHDHTASKSSWCFVVTWIPNYRNTPRGST